MSCHCEKSEAMLRTVLAKIQRMQLGARRKKEGWDLAGKVETFLVEYLGDIDCDIDDLLTEIEEARQ